MERNEHDAAGDAEDVERVPGNGGRNPPTARTAASNGGDPSRRLPRKIERRALSMRSLQSSE